MVEELCEEVDWVVGDDVGDLEQPDVERGHHELHEVVAEGHLLDLLLALVADQLAHLLRQPLTLRLDVRVRLHLPPHRLLPPLQALLVLLRRKLPVLLEQLLLSQQVVVRPAVLNQQISTLSM